MLGFIKIRARLKSSMQARNTGAGFAFSKQLTKILSYPIESLEDGRRRVSSI